ncbi:MAG: substrate-binding domain-containing protein [Candidatus Omnitrophica bacterium]|nr:substrate-binding domain-containing protein [Candidatus Omnitrophota bacterium]
MKRVGLILPHIAEVFSSAYYSRILAGVSEGLLNSACDLRVLLLKPNRSWDQYDFKSKEKIHGLILTQWSNYFNEEAFVQKIDLPCVVINDFDRRVVAPFVYADQVGGGRKAAEYFYHRGHRRVAAVAGPAWSQDSHQRMKGFLEFFQENGVIISTDNIVAGDYHEEMAYEIVSALFQKNIKPTALFCCNDLMAYGVIRRLKDLGIRCPDDVSVVGFDDHPLAITHHPPLTTIRVPMAELAREAATLLLDYFKRSDFVQPLAGEIVKPVELVERGSVKFLTDEIRHR